MTRVRLGEICERLSSGKSIKAAEVQESGTYPVIGGNGLRGYAERYNFDGECAVIGRQGAACGNVRFHSGKAYMTEHAVVAVANESNDSHYLAYLLSTMSLGRLSAQSAQPGLSVKTLSKQEIDLPSLEKQRQVVEVIGSIDAKIGVNAKLNGYLAA
ncbi:restriction endonuclease subunit S [Collinsella sp. AF33-16]|uniref:restriction endonuclease subunit S n=1 Tax=Collinsella sp. AF33-16 TaxID=2292012 RepID=UPI000E4FDC6D|nr:restriction endonuclease subunit S [Collinsella sp. AF33-16]RHM64566.1 restriction endonuclease subunit S [Collinsella sp. AF33-16]